MNGFNAEWFVERDHLPCRNTRLFPKTVTHPLEKGSGLAEAKGRLIWMPPRLNDNLILSGLAGSR